MSRLPKEFVLQSNNNHLWLNGRTKDTDVEIKISQGLRILSMEETTDTETREFYYMYDEDEERLSQCVQEISGLRNYVLRMIDGYENVLTFLEGFTGEPKTEVLSDSHIIELQEINEKTIAQIKTKLGELEKIKQFLLIK